MPGRKGKKKKNTKRQTTVKLESKRSSLFFLPLILGLVAFLIGLSLLVGSIDSKHVASYTSTKPCYAYDQNDEPIAWVNVTLVTNSSVPECHTPMNLTLNIRGLIVPSGNWTYAFLPGATAAYPLKEPLDWHHDPKKVIVLHSYDNFSWFGSRIINYTSEGDWDIHLHVLRATWYVIDCIPPNPLGEPMEIYTIPSAVHIASTESTVQIEAFKESARSRSFWSGIGFIITGLGLFVTTIREYKRRDSTK